MEIVFDTCKCVENDKVIFALSVLKADAIYWWDMESGGKTSQVAKTSTWEDFTRSFQEQFFLTATIIKLEEEFLKLEQGELTVKEYTARFIEKARFA